MFRDVQSWSARSTPRPFAYTGPITHIPEEWRSLDFLGFPDYEVSDLGRVRSLKGGKVRILKACPRNRNRVGYGSPYLAVGLRVNGVEHRRMVHVLVAQAFVENPFGRTTVAHCDGNILNCRAVNLRWATPEENARDKQIHGTQRCGPKTSDDDVRAMRALFGHLTDERIAVMFGITAAAVRAIRKGRRRAGVK
jgi:hypothetical protein